MSQWNHRKCSMNSKRRVWRCYDKYNLKYWLVICLIFGFDKTR
uniref:Uncharacterized protein n=1 Tax=Anguilla anguilla TaxID=7936 RepID=A0A0E9XC07_ANGAN